MPKFNLSENVEFFKVDDNTFKGKSEFGTTTFVIQELVNEKEEVKADLYRKYEYELSPSQEDYMIENQLESIRESREQDESIAESNGMSYEEYIEHR